MRNSDLLSPNQFRPAVPLQLGFVALAVDAAGPQPPDGQRSVPSPTAAMPAAIARYVCWSSRRSAGLPALT